MDDFVTNILQEWGFPELCFYFALYDIDKEKIDTCDWDAIIPDEKLKETFKWKFNNYKREKAADHFHSTMAASRNSEFMEVKDDSKIRVNNNDSIINDNYEMDLSNNLGSNEFSNSHMKNIEDTIDAFYTPLQKNKPIFQFLRNETVLGTALLYKYAVDKDIKFGRKTLSNLLIEKEMFNRVKTSFDFTLNSAILTVLENSITEIFESEMPMLYFENPQKSPDRLLFKEEIKKPRVTKAGLLYSEYLRYRTLLREAGIRQTSRRKRNT